MRHHCVVNNVVISSHDKDIDAMKSAQDIGGRAMANLNMYIPGFAPHKGSFGQLCGLRYVGAKATVLVVSTRELESVLYLSA